MIAVKVTVDQDRCIGAGQCVLTVPGVFDQDEDTGTVLLLREDLTDAERAEVARAAGFCPARAIAIDEPGE